MLPNYKMTISSTVDAILTGWVGMTGTYGIIINMHTCDHQTDL